MTKYLNVEGAGAGASSGFGANLLGAVGGSFVSTIIGGLFASSEAKKQRALEKELGLLDLQQQKELAIRLQDVQGDIAKQEIIYKYLAVQKNDEALAKIKSKRYSSYIVLGGGIFALAVVFIFLKRK